MLLIPLLFFANFSFAATETRPGLIDNFSGTWQGKGTFLNQNLAQPIPVDMDLSIDITPTELKIVDCWRDENLQYSRCYTNLFKVDETGQIFRSEKKLGDLFPDHIVIYWSNGQVSEQMFFGWSRATGLKYQYIFSAFDGASQVRNGGTLQKNQPETKITFAGKPSGRDEKWICEARDKFEKRYSSSPRENLTDARGEALENCETASQAPRSCRIEDCRTI